MAMSRGREVALKMSRRLSDEAKRPRLAYSQEGKARRFAYAALPGPFEPNDITIMCETAG
jgi:hypothetical protein